MVDKIDKQLRKLNPKQQHVYIDLIKRILRGNIDDLDVAKLKGSTNVFRVRKGDYRIIFQRLDDGRINIIAFEHRSETTYKNF